jgi:hypothetical protein
VELVGERLTSAAFEGRGPIRAHVHAHDPEIDPGGGRRARDPGGTPAPVCPIRNKYVGPRVAVPTRLPNGAGGSATHSAMPIPIEVAPTSTSMCPSGVAAPCELKVTGLKTWGPGVNGPISLRACGGVRWARESHAVGSRT